MIAGSFHLAAVCGQPEVSIISSAALGHLRQEAVEPSEETEDWAGGKCWLSSLRDVQPWASHLTSLSCLFLLGSDAMRRFKWLRIHFTNPRVGGDGHEPVGFIVTRTSSYFLAILGPSKVFFFPPLTPLFLNQIPQQESK